MVENYVNELKFVDLPKMLLELVEQTKKIEEDIKELKLMQLDRPEFKVYTVKEAAEILKMKPETLRKKIRNKEIGVSGSPDGGPYLLTQKDIEMYLESIHSQSIYEEDAKYRLN